MQVSVKTLIRRKDQEMPLTLTIPDSEVGEFFPGVLAKGDLHFDGQLRHLENGFLKLSGTAEVGAEVPCARCLQTCTLRLTTKVRDFFVAERNLSLWNEGDYANDEEDEVELYSGEHIDVLGLLLKRLIAVVPTKVLCRAECAGLCPHCGQDLNEKSCRCAAQEAEDDGNPFAKLKKLL